MENKQNKGNVYWSETFYTGNVTAGFCHLKEADTKYDEGGTYSVELPLDEDSSIITDFKARREAVEKLAVEFMKDNKVKHKKVSQYEDKYTTDGSKMKLKFAKKSLGGRYNIDVVDVDGVTPYDFNSKGEVYAGATLNVAYAFRCSVVSGKLCLSPKLVGVQVVKKSTGSAGGSLAFSSQGVVESGMAQGSESDGEFDFS